MERIKATLTKVILTLRSQILMAAIVLPAGAAMGQTAVASPSCDVEWSLGGPFVGASDGSLTASHGFQTISASQGPTALIPSGSGLSLVEADRVAQGYRLGFDASRARYLIRLFGPQGRLLRIFVIFPDQDELVIADAKLPADTVYLCVYNEAGNPLQSFKLMVEKPDRIAQAD